jgi:hypothetical protein
MASRAQEDAMEFTFNRTDKGSLIRKILLIGCVLILLAVAPGTGWWATVSAQTTFTDPNTCAPADCGKVSAFVPMQSAEAVHMGLIWTKDSEAPKILFHARFPEYRGTDVADPAVVDAAIAAGGLTNGVNDFNSSLRDVLHPSFRNSSNPTADSFQRLVYGGFLLRQGLSQSVPTRIHANRTMERALVFDIGHPDAFKSSGKFHDALLDESDFAMNRSAFKEVGFSAGLHYNIYCNARTTLADGRVYVFGGHDMQSDNGLYKVQIFDPETETWVPRRTPCTLENWRRDPFGLQLFASQGVNAPFYPGCDPHQMQSTQPSESSDQKYARWYPAAAPLPNGMIPVLGVGPDPLAAQKGKQGIPQRDDAFTATRVNQVVPEVYDAKADRNIALENARMAFPLYPQLEVVETGPGRDDWKVCTMNGVQDYGVESIPGGAKFGTGGAAPNFTEGNTFCLDVLGALKDPNRDVAAKDHWELLDKASEVRPYCCPTASLIEIDDDGHTVSHKWLMISGLDANRRPTATVEMIDFTDSSPRWKKIGELLFPLTTTKAVVLPTGKILIGQGLNRGLASTGDPVLDFERREGLRFQMFDPATGISTPLARTTISRGLHGTATLLPDASVFFAGENREALVQSNDPSYPLVASYGVLPRGDPDQGVPAGQIFLPPYLFNKNGTATRPAIMDAPKEIEYRGHFDITVAGDPDDIASVVLLRSDHNTHSFTGGDRYVKLAFHQKGAQRKQELRVVAPKLPAQAVPGIYMLFVVDRNGVPSVGKKVVLPVDTRG